MRAGCAFGARSMSGRPTGIRKSKRRSWRQRPRPPRRATDSRSRRHCARKVTTRSRTTCRPCCAGVRPPRRSAPPSPEKRRVRAVAPETAGYSQPKRSPAARLHSLPLTDSPRPATTANAAGLACRDNQNARETNMKKSESRMAPALVASAGALLLGISGAAAEDAELVQANDPYFRQAQAALQRILTQERNTNQAKNVILVVGDGMGFSTVTAARIFEGQQRGVDGESNVLAWEAFPYLAASKTYSSDAQITDSAPSAVAMTTGVKTKNDLMGLDHTARLENCEDQKTKQVTTLWELAETIGMSTGAVTTATITHATPGATSAHIASRDWESDSAMPPEAIEAGCTDIARQLVEMPYGDGFEVALGGGRANFLPETVDDPED